MSEKEFTKIVTGLKKNELVLFEFQKSKKVCLLLRATEGRELPPKQTENRFKLTDDEGLSFEHTIIFSNGKSLKLELNLENTENRRKFKILANQEILEYIQFGAHGYLNQISGAKNSVKIFLRSSSFEL